MHTRSQAGAAAAAALTLVSLPDDAFLLIIAACNDRFDVPHFYTVKGLGCLSKGMLQQLRRLQPLVGVDSLAVVQGYDGHHGPWRVALFYWGKLTEAVLDQAQQGRVRSIDACPVSNACSLTTAVKRRVVPELLGAGCSLLKLKLNGVSLPSFDGMKLWGCPRAQAAKLSTWAAIFGEAAVCSSVLRSLHLQSCSLRGPLPELRLPALQKLFLHNNQLTGTLEPLRGCTALQLLSLSNNNNLTGDLEPLRSCTALRELLLSNNRHTGGLAPLQNCKALRELYLENNQLEGDIGPLWGCKALQVLRLENNQLVPTDEDKAHFEKQNGLQIVRKRFCYP